VELVGLCASTVKWLSESYNRREYPHSGVSYRSRGNISCLPDRGGAETGLPSLFNFLFPRVSF